MIKIIFKKKRKENKEIISMDHLDPNSEVPDQYKKNLEIDEKEN